jgi:hypothetical protein
VSPPRLLAAAAVVAVAAMTSGQPAGGWLTGQTGRGTARWTRQGDTLTYEDGAAFGWAVREGASHRDGWVEITCDGRRLFAARDETFPDAGLVGIWSQADSVIEFDQFGQEGAP